MLARGYARNPRGGKGKKSAAEAAALHWKRNDLLHRDGLQILLHRNIAAAAEPLLDIVEE
jgi:hypothetical protein